MVTEDTEPMMRLLNPAGLLAVKKRARLSLADIAQHAGCDRSFIAHLTAGRKTTCRQSIATKIAEAVDLPIEVLFVPTGYAARVQINRTPRTETAA